MDKKALLIVGRSADDNAALARKIAEMAGAYACANIVDLKRSFLRTLLRRKPKTLIVGGFKGSKKQINKIKEFLSGDHMWASRPGIPGGFLVPTPNIILISDAKGAARHISKDDRYFRVHQCVAPRAGFHRDISGPSIRDLVAACKLQEHPMCRCITRPVGKHPALEAPYDISVQQSGQAFRGSNFIFATGSKDPLNIRAGDRRYANLPAGIREDLPVADKWLLLWEGLAADAQRRVGKLRSIHINGKDASELFGSGFDLPTGSRAIFAKERQFKVDYVNHLIDAALKAKTTTVINVLLSELGQVDISAYEYLKSTNMFWVRRG